MIFLVIPKQVRIQNYNYEKLPICTLAQLFKRFVGTAPEKYLNIHLFS